MVRKTGYPQWSEWLSNEACSGGAILDLLSHDIDQALRLFGMPSFVSAVSDGAMDTMRGELRYNDGLDVRIEGGWYEPGLPFAAGLKSRAALRVLLWKVGRWNCSAMAARRLWRCLNLLNMPSRWPISLIAAERTCSLICVFRGSQPKQSK